LGWVKGGNYTYLGIDYSQNRFSLLGWVQKGNPTHWDGSKSQPNPMVWVEILAQPNPFTSLEVWNKAKEGIKYAQ
jgi:hypothetical protein